MSLATGDRLGPYEILEPIGAGGMGEVYKARDLRLNRIVAVKVSKEQFSERFEREARNVAALNHSNICHLYDVGPNYLVMEFIEGESLAGPLPFDTAIAYARQIAEALEAAHDKGIIHRDLKPANIKVTPEGVVKVLDFGLAKALDTDTHADGRVSENSPTLTIGETKAGTILGTAAYMSPEQAKGKSADRRADIWSFGVVFYEMLTGRRLFRGETVGDVLASVIKEEPKLDALPASVRGLVTRCLIKEPKHRLQAIGEARIILENPSAVETRAPSRWTGRLGWIVAALATAAAAALAFLHFRESPPPVRTVRFELRLPENSSVEFFKLSPNGEFMVIADTVSRKLEVRALDSLEFRTLPGTDGARYPFWSPDSSTIGFFAGGKLKKVSVNGGPTQTLCDALDGRGGTWNTDGVIVFSPDVGSPLQRVAMGGGVPAPVTKLADDGENHRFPEFLPDQRHFLYAVNGPKPDHNGIYVGSLEAVPPVRLLADVSSTAYVPAGVSSKTGHILFRRESNLMAAPFDPQRLQLTGDVFPAVAEPVGVSANNAYGAFSASSNGVLAHQAGGFTADRELVWMDRTGKRLRGIGKSGPIQQEALSPDEKAVAYVLADGTGRSDVWLYDFARNAASRFTFGTGQAVTPLWSPDGGKIAYGLGPTSLITVDIFQKPANGGKEEPLQRSGQVRLFDWSPDGKNVVFTPELTVGKFKADLFLLPMQGDHKPVPYLQTTAFEYNAQFSQDGHWMSYTSDESGMEQVNVQPIPASGEKHQVSTAGGSRARWRKDGKELYYVSADRKLMAVPVKTSPSFEAGAPQELFPLTNIGTNPYTFYYQPSKDGQRFLMNVSAGGPAATPPITVVLNWRSH